MVVIAGPKCRQIIPLQRITRQITAIVTEIPGTTRDALEAVVDTGKWPLRLVDTAGLRETDDQIERLGIEVSETYLSSAQVVLACGDSQTSLEHTGTLVSQLTEAPVIAVRTKADLVSNGEQLPQPVEGIAVSAETGSGLQTLVAAIESVIERRQGSIAADLPILTRVRHRKALEVARAEIGQFREAWRLEKLPATVAVLHLRTAVTELEELIGTLDVEDVLDRVFSSFCVGK